MESKFESRVPSHQNAIDLFRDHWAGMIEEVYPGVISGPMPVFASDPRPSIAAKHLGFAPGTLRGMNILELGPLEGAHTYQMVKLGADSVLAIEANSEAFQKCLIVKEVLQILRSRFLLGDCLKFLQETSDPFDMIFCSGILYHMENPFELIKSMSKHTDRIFLWTHYYNPDEISKSRIPKSVACDGIEVTFYEQAYGDTAYGTFWGGNKPTASWLSKPGIERCFSHFGYKLTIHEDNVGHINGPCVTATAIR